MRAAAAARGRQRRSSRPTRVAVRRKEIAATTQRVPRRWPAGDPKRTAGNAGIGVNSSMAPHPHAAWNASTWTTLWAMKKSWRIRPLRIIALWPVSPSLE
jgi:hypothetical protein